VYLTWRECEAQVKGVSSARYRSFRTRAEAVEFLAVYGGGGGHFSLFEGEGFRADRGASFSDEFGRLSSSQGWEAGSKRYNEERTRALHSMGFSFLPFLFPSFSFSFVSREGFFAFGRWLGPLPSE
jgi:hypothetical protein